MELWRLYAIREIQNHFQVEPRDSLIIHQLREQDAKLQGATTIGIEVEVKYSSYFPELYERYHLATRSFNQLSIADQQKLTADTSAEEDKLLPLLRKVTEFGIPKGQDRYWEFAFRPAYHPFTLAEEVSLLRQLSLIPENQKHSLHITLGGLPNTSDAYMLLFCLELLGYTSAKRLAAGIQRNKAVAWGRKGFGGIRERREGVELGKTVAVEFRTLELPTTDAEVDELLHTAWFLAETIRRHDMRELWLKVRAAVAELATMHGLQCSSNWGRAFGDEIDTWTAYANKFDLIDNTHLRHVVKEVIRGQDTQSLPNHYLHGRNVGRTFQTINKR